MYAVSVSLLSNISVDLDLTYFSNKKLQIGSLVSVTLKNKQVFAVVIQINNVADLRNEIKKSSFALKKITANFEIRIFDETFYIFLKEYCDRYICNFSYAVNKLFPPEVIGFLVKNNISAPTKKRKTQKIEYIFDSLPARNQASRGTIRICPTIEKINMIASSCGGCTVINQDSLDDLLIKPNKNTFVILPEYFFACAYTTNKKVMLDFESENSYAEFINGKFDYSHFIKKYFSKFCGGIIADIHPRIETYSDKYPKPTLSGLARSEPLPRNENFGKNTISEIYSTLNDGANVLIYTQSKGISKTTICEDCYEIIKCPACNHDLLLVEKNKMRNFRCKFCKKKFPIINKCPNCNSWRLKPFGFSEESISLELVKKTPGAQIIKLVNSKKISKSNYTLLRKNTPKIIITDNQNFDLCKIRLAVCPTLDNLVFGSDYRAFDAFRKIILSILQKSERLIIQSANYEFISNLVDFDSYIKVRTREILARKRHNFPPFGDIYKLSVNKNSSKCEIFETTILNKNCKIINKFEFLDKLIYVIIVPTNVVINLKYATPALFKNDFLSLEFNPFLLFSA